MDNIMSAKILSFSLRSPVSLIPPVFISSGWWGYKWCFAWCCKIARHTFLYGWNAVKKTSIYFCSVRKKRSKTYSGKQDRVASFHLGSFRYAWFINIHICVCEYPFQWEMKQMNTLFLGITKWSNGLRRWTSCKAISYPHNAQCKCKYDTGCSLNIVFFLKILWFFWTLQVLLQRRCLTYHSVHTLTPRGNRERPEYISKSSKKHNI